MPVVFPFWLTLPDLPPSSTGARTERPCNPLTPASYRPGPFLAMENNHERKVMNYRILEITDEDENLIPVIRVYVPIDTRGQP